MRILYRLRQFWRTITAITNSPLSEQAQALLSPEQAALFMQLPPAEKAHALSMAHRLIEQGETQPDLLVAALLHDIGKLHYHQHPLERSLVVLVRAILPNQARLWGSLPPGGLDKVPRWGKAFVVTEQHASWGAELARQVGVSPLTESLIRLHHHLHSLGTDSAETSLLHKLRMVDNES